VGCYSGGLVEGGRRRLVRLPFGCHAGWKVFQGGISPHLEYLEGQMDKLEAFIDTFKA
jgi:hypothetical protein